jgi:hypothetical protein
MAAVRGLLFETGESMTPQHIRLAGFEVFGASLDDRFVSVAFAREMGSPETFLDIDLAGRGGMRDVVGVLDRWCFAQERRIAADWLSLRAGARDRTIAFVGNHLLFRELDECDIRWTAVDPVRVTLDGPVACPTDFAPGRAVSSGGGYLKVRDPLDCEMDDAATYQHVSLSHFLGVFFQASLERISDDVPERPCPMGVVGFPEVRAAAAPFAGRVIEVSVHVPWIAWTPPKVEKWLKEACSR